MRYLAFAFCVIYFYSVYFWFLYVLFLPIRALETCAKKDYRLAQQQACITDCIIAKHAPMKTSTEVIHRPRSTEPEQKYVIAIQYTRKLLSETYQCCSTSEFFSKHKRPDYEYFSSSSLFLIPRVLRIDSKYWPTYCITRLFKVHTAYS